jgi:hypothetical protein
LSTWKPIDRAEFEELLRDELAQCLPEERALFERCRIAVERRPFAKNDYLDSAFVVALHDDEILYYNDIEDGFNTSPVGPDGAILEYWCNQDSLQVALHTWLLQ